MLPHLLLGYISPVTGMRSVIQGSFSKPVTNWS